MTDEQTRKQASKQPPEPLTDADRRLFRHTVGALRPITQDRVRPETPRPPARPLQTEANEREVMAQLLDPPEDPAALETGEELLFLRSGLQQRVLKRLRRGHYSIGAELDLHQMNAATAAASIDDLIHQCQLQNVSCAKIIHGKGLRSKPGGPVLKSLTNHHLRRRAAVLAFASAPAHDGGTGAVYVLLKAS